MLQKLGKRRHTALSAAASGGREDGGFKPLALRAVAGRRAPATRPRSASRFPETSRPSRARTRPRTDRRHAPPTEPTPFSENAHRFGRPAGRLRGVCLRHRAGVPPARPALRAKTPRLAGRSVAADRGGGRHPYRRALHAAVASRGDRVSDERARPGPDCAARRLRGGPPLHDAGHRHGRTGAEARRPPGAAWRPRHPRQPRLVGRPRRAARAARADHRRPRAAGREHPILENEAVRLTKDGRPFWLVGLGDQLALLQPGRKRYRGVDDLPGALAKTTDDAPAILLAHEPDIFPEVPDRVALTLSGHTHGGQVRLFNYSPLVPSRYGNRYAYGHVVEDERHLIVCGGLGTSILPVRFGVPPEVVVVDLGAPRPEGTSA